MNLSLFNQLCIIHPIAIDEYCLHSRALGSACHEITQHSDKLSSNVIFQIYAIQVMLTSYVIIDGRFTCHATHAAPSPLALAARPVS
jgi:hypothetical protein